MPVGVLAVDTDGRPTRWNDTLSDLLGLAVGDPPDPNRLGGIALEAGIEGDRASALLLAALRDGVVTADTRSQVTRSDGTFATLSLTAGPLRGADGRPAGAVLVATDATERHETEALRDAFLGVLSHELRTPVTSIFGGTELLRRTDLPEGVRDELLDDIRLESERLHRLVEDLLVVARLERGASVAGRDPVLLQRLIPRVVRAERRHWPRCRFGLRIERDLPAVQGEDGYVEQVIHNLVSNAAKYGPLDGLVEIEAALVNGEVVVRVLDEGPGIPEWAADEVFRLFYRMPSLAASAPGAGIGLYVSRAIVLAMDGRIWARPRRGGGAEVGFALHVYPLDGPA